MGHVITQATVTLLYFNHMHATLGLLISRLFILVMSCDILNWCQFLLSILLPLIIKYFESSRTLTLVAAVFCGQLKFPRNTKPEYKSVFCCSKRKYQQTEVNIVATSDREISSSRRMVCKPDTHYQCGKNKL